MLKGKALPLARSSKPDLASGCLSRDLGVKMISCLKGRRKGKKFPSLTNNRFILSAVSSLCALKKLQRKKVFISFFTLIYYQHIARNISTGKTKQFFNNQINKTLCARSTKSRTSKFFHKKPTILSPVGFLPNLLWN